jgi:hypothetical protein
VKSLLPLAMIALLLLTKQTHAQDAPDAEKPRVLVCVPLGAIPGETTKLVARGLKLEGATEVKSADERVTAKLVSQGKANVPGNQNASQVGDEQIEFELEVPADYPPGDVELTYVTPKGEAMYKLAIGGEFPIVLEKEPNPGFRQSQEITLPTIVLGQIENPNDVDVYSFEAAAGQKFACEIVAQRRGSALDAVLTVFDASGHILATADDLPESRDSKLEFTAAAAGKHFVVVQDAHDQGGPAHPYRLTVRPLE